MVNNILVFCIYILITLVFNCRVVGITIMGLLALIESTRLKAREKGEILVVGCERQPLGTAGRVTCKARERRHASFEVGQYLYCSIF